MQTECLLKASALLLLAGAAAAWATGPSAGAAADGVPLEQAPPTGAEGVKYFYQQAQQYRVRQADARQPLALTESPLLNWSNPARTNEHGILVVWLNQGRPEALATLFTYQINQRVYEKHELLSLSGAGLSATFRGQPAWSPSRPGVKWTELPDVEPPAAQPRLRALQMRRIAREFTGVITNGKDETTTLRPLPQPLYRYEKPTGDVVDGALFSLNVGTDPEVIILIEANQAASAARWQYSLARLHYNQLQVERNGQPVWSADAIPELMNDRTGQQEYMNQPYYTYYPQTLMLRGAAAP